MISGRQIREARALLNWSISELHIRANVSEEIIKRAESVNGTPSITLHHGRHIQQAFEIAGIGFWNKGSQGETQGKSLDATQARSSEPEGHRRDRRPHS